MFKITQQTQADSQVIEALMTEAFGPNRYDRSVWALRPGAPVAALCLVGYDGDQAVGSLRFWEVMLNDEIILLLGPLAVQPHVRGKGLVNNWFKRECGLHARAMAACSGVRRA
jgi:predicted N-acetyltransferase YhbS